ncbi:type II secretion system F family protein [Haloarculaceae archaeon H-GB2-1]|nr:type II secretion system F family protein [Haloarculaceae archaeon H-GB2-1]
MGRPHRRRSRRRRVRGRYLPLSLADAEEHDRGPPPRHQRGASRTTAFIYALARGGMEIPQALRILARNREVYGDSADELSLAIREIDMFGSDVISALTHVSERSPSDQFKTFTENFASVLGSGQSVTDFLEEQYERYQEESAERQGEILELLATIAEGTSPCSSPASCSSSRSCSYSA